MTVITVSREYGSAGDKIAKILAEKLGYQFVDKELIEEILVKYGMVAFDDLYSSEQGIWGRLDSEKKRIVEMLNKTIMAFARSGNCVILGRGAFAVLQDYNNVINVDIREPLPSRINNIMESEGISDEAQAKESIEQHDRVRIAFLQTFYNVKCNDTAWFDICLNTAIIEADKAAEWIAEIAGKIDQKADKDKHVSEIKEDTVLQSAIREVLE